MTATSAPAEPAEPAELGWDKIEAIFSSLGRVVIILDRHFQILRASHTLDDLAGAGTTDAAVGKPIDELIGARLFGPSETLREALQQGRREEGRRGVLRCEGETARLVSITTSALSEAFLHCCDPRARYLVVVRPAEDEDAALQNAIVSHGLVTRSPAMSRIVRLVESLNLSEATVLITGESGTGKEVIARAIHAQSPRHDGPFVPVNCAALPADLLESELFGHVRGAFTGAVKDRVGRLELARGGTLFLDEAGDIPLGVQVKLLRVLQDRVFERVGESAPRQLEARIIAATNADMAQAIREGRMREDLYYRLRVVPIHIPPLRERPEDVGLIAQHLLARIGGREGRALWLSPDTLSVLERYPWPGNVRELENALEYAVALCRGQTIQAESLPPEIRDGAPAALPPRAARPSVAGPHADDESTRIRGSLERNLWNRSKAAAELGMSRTKLWRRMRELHIGFD